LTNEFSKTVHALLKVVWNLEQEAATLAILRDTLLPKLLSGEMRVPDAEKALEA